MKKINVSYINRKTLAVYNLISVDEENGTALVVDCKTSEEKSYKLSTLKKNYKRIETEVEVEEPKAETKPLTKHQIAAKKNIKGAYNDYIGGLENSVQDGQLDEMPSIEEMFSGVYVESISTSFQMMGGLSVVGGSAPICMRFAGKQFIREYIAELFRKDGYEVPDELVKVPEKKPGHSNFVEGERVNLRNDEAERLINVRAFTGMLIGSFKVEEETATTIIVNTAKGVMEFDKETGKQTNMPQGKERYANRMDV